MKQGGSLDVRKSGSGLVLTLPAAAPDPFATVVCLAVEGEPSVETGNKAALNNKPPV